MELIPLMDIPGIKLVRLHALLFSSISALGMIALLPHSQGG